MRHTMMQKTILILHKCVMERGPCHMYLLTIKNMHTWYVLIYVMCAYFLHPEIHPDTIIILYSNHH